MLKNSFKLSESKATIIGQLSLIIWAFTASLAVSLDRIPPFEILIFITSAGFITSSIVNTIYGNWTNLKHHPKFIWIIGIVGVLGNDVFYIMSFKNAPPVHVDLINYLWPICVIICSGIFLKEKLSPLQIFAVLLSFFGLYVLFYEDISAGGANNELTYGYYFAFIAAILWTMYVIVSKKYGKTTPEMFSIYSLVGAIAATLLHLKFEGFVVPTTYEYLCLIAIGSLSHCLAYIFWDVGIKKGNFKFLSIFSYTSPLISVLLLIIFGFAELTIPIILATIIITIGSAIASKGKK